MSLLNHGAPPPTSAAYRVTGQYLARAHLSRQQRAKLAAALANGTAVISPLTAQQSAAMARVPVADVTKVRRNGNGPKPRRRSGRAHPAQLARRAGRGRTRRRSRRDLGHHDLAGRQRRAGGG
jgi:hypothetical protein